MKTSLEETFLVASFTCTDIIKFHAQLFVYRAQAVVIATPTHTHEELVNKALEAGKIF